MTHTDDKAEPRRELTARDLRKMTAELCRLRNDFFDKFGFPKHADRADALRQFLWDNKTGICAALARPAQGDKTAALQDSAYIAGLGEGFRLGLDENHEGLAKRITARDGYLAPLTRPALEQTVDTTKLNAGQLVQRIMRAMDGDLSAFPNGAKLAEYIAAEILKLPADYWHRPAPSKAWQPGDPRCDQCDNGIEPKWEYCAWCGQHLAADYPSHEPNTVRPAPDDSPGTPLARLKGIADFAIANGLCTGIEAKPPELFLIEAFHACHDEIEALRRFLEIALDEHENHFGKINADKYPNIWTVQARKRLTTKDVQK